MLREANLSMVGKVVPLDKCILVMRGSKGFEELAPNRNLLDDFNKTKMSERKKLNATDVEAHNEAFIITDYEARFRLQIAEDDVALKKLKIISERSSDEDVYLVCYEGPKKGCHRRILMRICEERFGAEVRVEGIEPRK